MGNRFQRIHDLVGLLHGLYPPGLAEEWDNVGLQVGDPSAKLEQVLVALDPTLAAVDAAADFGAQALVTHHPLLFKPLKQLTPDDVVGKVAWKAVEKGVAIISAHTNLDSAASGLNSWLAETLALQDLQPLQSIPGDYLKLVVYVPSAHLDDVADAVFAGGAGRIGAYDRCSFRSPGTGTFRPGEGTQPYLGESGTTEQVEEFRLETVVPRARLSRTLEKMLKAHPYEEVAYDLIPLQNHVPDAGMGRVGVLAEAQSLEGFAEQVKERLGCTHLRLAGERPKKISKVAVCGGSGAGLLAAAKFRGADVLVTGDAKYHDARLAEDLGLALIDAGHFATEQLMVGRLTEELERATQERGWDVRYHPFSGEFEPFRVF